MNRLMCKFFVRKWAEKLFAAIIMAGLSGLVLADTKIKEVQPWPIDAPTQLIIWGTEFGENPEFHFGTAADPLVIDEASDLCDTPLGAEAPPLDASEVDCVVVDLPVVNNGEPHVPAGDYLLAIWVTGPEECAAKPSSLTFLYTPSDCTGSNLQGADCSGDMSGSVGAASLSAQGHNNATWSINNNPVMSGELVTFTSGGNGKWPNELILEISEGGFFQSLQIHTSCSEPLAIGDVFGSLELVDMDAPLKNGMRHDLYDLTLGSVGPEGPQGPPGEQGEQGPQGKIGDTGAQGPQGKVGDAGAQGPQGKVGDAGAQGPQGKVGDTGAQGPQGKAGEAGAQGPQGKVGEAGAQGPQGKVGDAGAQGPQGKVGETGAQGPQGKAGEAGAQGPQGKVGDAGAQGPQGKVGDTGAQGPQGKAGEAGAQGPQGKVGEAGAQGPQGKVGEAGAQGPQGKAGEAGAQGPQGKIGDAGAQGPQGKVGEAGAQGPQGKVGDTGAQGPQGKQGDTGAQGPQGKQGEQGPKGDAGAGTSLVCFATDQTIGTQGKYIGLGQQGGSHAEVGVILPSIFNGGKISSLIVKVSQGNTPRGGIARIYHDGPTDAGLAFTGDCDIDENDEPVGYEGSSADTAATTICEVSIEGLLSNFDSLSVKVQTDGGSFEGATACVVIEPASP